MKIKREVPRYPFRWQVTIEFNEEEDRRAFKGVTLDLSVKGCAILTEHNVFSEYPVTLRLALPPTYPGGKHKVVKITRARMAYTVFSSGHQTFRCGIHFLNFNADDRRRLQQALDERTVLALDLAVEE